MFGFNFPRVIHTNERNLPRVRVTELSRRQSNSSVVMDLGFEMFFIEQHREVEMSYVSLLGLRCQRLLWQSEKSLALLLNYLRCSYTSPGIYLSCTVVIQYN